MASLVPFRSPLGVYFRSALGVRDEGKGTSQYFEFQITAPLNTAFYISLQESRITYPDGTIAAWNETLTHKAGNDGWYFCERGTWDIWATPPVFTIQNYYGPIMTLVPGGNTYSPENPCPMTAVRFNRGLYKVKELDAQRTSIGSLDIRPLRNLKKLTAGQGEFYTWGHIAYVDEVDFEMAFLTELELGNPTLEWLTLYLVNITELEKTGMPNLKYLTILHSGALETLDVSGMQKLEEISIKSSTIQEALFFECSLLSSISIFNCPLLSSLDFHDCFALQSLSVYGVERGIIGVPPDSEIDRVGADIKTLNCTELTSLKEIFVNCCPELEEIDLTDCSGLEKLKIGNCDSLSSIIFSCHPLITGGTGSNYLEISDCASLVFLDISGFKNLVNFKINRTSLSFIDLSDMDKDEGMNVDLRQNALEDIRFGVLSETQIFRLNAAWNNFSQSKVVGILRMVYDHVILHPSLTGGSLILTYTEWEDDFPPDFWTKWDELANNYGWTINISQAPFPW